MRVFGDPVQFRISVIEGLFLDLRSGIFVLTKQGKQYSLSDADGCLP
jgi:hypothetical protein